MIKLIFIITVLILMVSLSHKVIGLRKALESTAPLIGLAIVEIIRLIYPPFYEPMKIIWIVVFSIYLIKQIADLVKQR